MLGCDGEEGRAADFFPKVLRQSALIDVVRDVSYRSLFDSNTGPRKRGRSGQ